MKLPNLKNLQTLLKSNDDRENVAVCYTQDPKTKKIGAYMEFSPIEDENGIMTHRRIYVCSHPIWAEIWKLIEKNEDKEKIDTAISKAIDLEEKMCEVEDEVAKGNDNVDENLSKMLEDFFKYLYKDEDEGNDEDEVKQKVEDYVEGKDENVEGKNYDEV